ncbi:MAG TPA: hypothetical protein VN709_08845 [Terriglobales bacterium]|nr:hypothetical protein [Terriglobales bacterium]
MSRKLALLLILAGMAGAVGQAAFPAPASTSEIGAVRRQLLDSLRMSPTVANAVKIDPTLLGDQAYLTRTNPDLAHLLQAHPEIARNPDFYLFADLGPGEPRPAEHWEEPYHESDVREVMSNVAPMLVFLGLIILAGWVLRAVLDHRRWNRAMTARTDAHQRLLEKLGSSQELLSYAQSENGRQLLELGGLDRGDTMLRTPALLGRMLTAVQFGLVFTLAGWVLAGLRNDVAGGHDPLLIIGLLSLAIGVGLILSAAVSFVMSRHLGLLDRAGQ